jgi:hypothetical protein
MDPGLCVEDLDLAQMQAKEDFWARQPQSVEELEEMMSCPDPEREYGGVSVYHDPRSPHYRQGEEPWDCPYGFECYGNDCGACHAESECEICGEPAPDGVQTDQGFLCQMCRIGIARATKEDPFTGSN